MVKINDDITVVTSKKRLIRAAIIVTALSLYAYMLSQYFVISNIQYKFLTYEIGIAAIALSVKVKMNGRKRLFYDLGLLLILSIMMALTLDFLNGMYINPSEEGPTRALIRFSLSVIFCYFIYLLCIAICGRVKTAVILGSAFLFVGGIISYVVLELRGSRLLFGDLSAIGTALEIAGGYHDVPVKAPLYLGIISLLCLSCVIARILPIRYLEHSITRLACFMVFLYGFFIVYSTGFEEYNYSWTEVENSYLYSFFANAKLLNVAPGTAYKAEAAEETIEGASPRVTFLSSAYNARESIAAKFPEYVEKTGTTNPNIIVIMNESLTDLEVYGDIDTEEEIMPTINNLDNALKGDLFTEVRGGGTADSEYTFLTGNSTLLLAASARPYQLYVNEDSQNIVSELDRIGYKTIAIHPGYEGSWNRTAVYQDFKFQEFYSGSSFENAAYRRNPNLISDIATYEKIIELYNNKGDSPLFIFDVTLQNHGGYAQGYDNLKRLQVNENIPDEVVEFLSLVHASDEDFAKLINYFKNQDEPTLIVMFGDHQPNFTSNYFEQVIGKEEDDYTLKESQRIQATPYVIWANYDLPANTVGSISINYLSTLMLECAGIDPTPYNIYLANLHTRLKIVNRKGIITDKEEYYALEDNKLPEKYKKYIEDYKNVLYYNMFDLDNLDKSLFINSSDSG